MEHTKLGMASPLASLFLLVALIVVPGCAGARRPTPTVPPADVADRYPASALLPPTSLLAPSEFVIGVSRENRPIIAYQFGELRAPTIIIAAIHGDERIAAELADRFVAELSTLKESDVPGGVIIIPRLNPDGLALGTRSNAAGVDLNRNFPATNWRRGTPRSPTFGGASPMSEPETVALVKLLDARQPRQLVSIHSMHRGACNNYDGPGKPLAELMNRHNRYPVLASIGYPTPGSLGSFAGKDRNLPMVTLELPKSAKLEEVWPANRAALRAVLGFVPRRS